MSVKSDNGAANERGRGLRHELRYLLDYADAGVLKSCLCTLLRQDVNTAQSGAYRVRDLYFDDYRNSSYKEKLTGGYGSRYRIRIYNGSDAVIRLERKRNRDMYVSKESAELTRAQVERILRGDYEALLKTGQPLCDEFYFECVGRIMRPRVIVDFEREPYVIESGDVRITFDENVRAVTMSNNIFDPDLPCLYMLEPHQMLLEVKYSGFLPGLIHRLLPKSGLCRASFSKYTRACDKTMYLTSNIY